MFILKKRTPAGGIRASQGTFSSLFLKDMFLKDMPRNYNKCDRLLGCLHFPF